MKTRRPAGTGMLLGIAMLLGCGGNDTSSRAEHPSARAQDSAIARSNLPGAKGVGAAMRLSDSADARRRREDSVSNAVP
ncbi:MAG TPA: hypothetical protein VFU23_10885 [Gemmatimonadales bacterium]|nr:hypothetical protein [Gemmatimonadales bacterium]